MTRIQFEVPGRVAAEVERRAGARGVSTGRYVAEIVSREVSKSDSGGGWPEGYFERVVGRWEGGELVRPAQPPLEIRDEL